jgi:hypothetical protein
MVRHPNSRPPEYRSGNEHSDDGGSDDSSRRDPAGEQTELSWFCSSQRSSRDEVTTQRGGVGAGEDGCGGDDGVGEGGESV